MVGAYLDWITNTKMRIIATTLAKLGGSTNYCTHRWSYKLFTIFHLRGLEIVDIGVTTDSSLSLGKPIVNDNVVMSHSSLVVGWNLKVRVLESVTHKGIGVWVWVSNSECGVSEVWLWEYWYFFNKKISDNYIINRRWNF